MSGYNIHDILVRRGAHFANPEDWWYWAGWLDVLYGKCTINYPKQLSYARAYEMGMADAKGELCIT